MGEKDNMQTGAREVADLIKEGKTEQAGDRLRDDFKNMSTDEFRAFVKQVDQYNADDRSVNKNLPDLVVNETEMAGTKAIQSLDITTPGKVFGNMWRNSTEILDAGHGAGMLSHTESLIQGRNAQLEQVYQSMDRTSNQQAKPIEQRKGS